MAVDFEIPAERMFINCECGVKIAFNKSDVVLYTFGVGSMTVPRKKACVQCPICKSHKSIEAAKEYRDGNNT